MDEINVHIDELIIKYLDKSISETELEDLERWRNRSAANQLLFEQLTDAQSINTELEKLYTYDEEKNWERIRNILVVEHKAPIRKMNWKRLIAAASIVLMVSAAGYLIYNNQSYKRLVSTGTNQKLHDVAPGGNKAVLILANGSQIVLDSANNGALTQQGNTRIIKLQAGQLAYKPVAGETVSVEYNTITTPRGGQYQVELVDGSKVWLNAASSLHFPTSFNGKYRTVELMGEGYFEVAKNASRPFQVVANGMKVEVLGTHFNINAYNDEEVISTTLLEGSVKVNKGAASKIIKPGEQARMLNTLSLSENNIIVNKVNTDEIIAWKEGKFYFDNADIKQVLRQYARWYNVDVIYEGKVSEEKFFGIMNRNTTLSNVLKSLQANGIKFRIEGNKLFVQS